MGLQWIDFLFFLILLILFASVLAIDRITQTHKVYLAFHFVMMLWPFGQFALFTTGYPDVQLVYIKMSFVAIGLLGPGWLVFVFFLTQRASVLKPGRLAAYLLPAALCVAGVIWNPGHAFMVPVGGSYLEREYGPLFWFQVLVQFAYIFAALLIMFQALRSVYSVNQRKQLALALLGIFVLTCFSLLDIMVNVVLSRWMPFVPGLMSLGILLSDLCFIVSIYRYGVFDILSMAQRDLFEHMSTGIVVLDEHNKVLEVNRGAEPFVKVAKGEKFDMERFLAPMQGQGEVGEFLYRYRHQPHERMQTEVRLPEGHPRNVAIQISPILDNEKSVLARVITFHDVTELRRLIDDLNRKNEALHERNLELIAIQEELFRANQKLEQMAITDGLTGCYNRRYLMQQLEQEVLLHQRYGTPFAIFLFDIDFFKQINDRYGHLVGDEVIRSTADIVRSKLRRTDILARYGGEEFTVYLPHTNLQQAELLAGRVMKAVADNVICCGTEKVSVTISMGIVCEEHRQPKIDDPKEFLRELFSRADAALYRAKHGGRNRVVSAGADG
mgnify:CR=1 FL=1|jgi:diguanylate cyclase (GGDEF)-like protein/PAS domain S-box-containing protein